MNSANAPPAGIEYGFHKSFITAYSDKSLPVKITRDACRVTLIYSECGVLYDVGWKISFEDDTLVPITVFINLSA